MLSGFTSKLRKRATELRQGRWSDGADDARLMEEAADTIDRLRCMNNDLSRLKAENDKLRELVRDMWDVALHPEMFGDGSYLLRLMRDLGIEVER